jgi:hypothetical protein
MSSPKIVRPAFQSVEMDADPIDSRLEAKAAEKGIPTLVTTRPEASLAGEPRPAAEPATAAPRKPSRGAPKEATPRSRMKGVTLELPDYVWVALKIKAAEDMVSTRHIIMSALRRAGIRIDDVDMVEDGRRLRK